MCIYDVYCEGIKHWKLQNAVFKEENLNRLCYNAQSTWTVVPGAAHNLRVTSRLPFSWQEAHIAYHLSSVIYYLTHNWLLFLH